MTGGQVAPEPWTAAAAMALAVAETGLDDFGEPSVEEGLAQLLDSVQAESELNEFGRLSLQADVLRLLGNRLRMQQDLKRHPEIRDESVGEPIVVVGMPRTGTTKLHRMLAADPGSQKIPLWRVLNPAPLPPAPDGSDMRRAIALGFEDLLTARFPDMAVAHPMQVDEPEEEVLLMQLAFQTELNGFYYRAPSYLSWVAAQPPAPSYELLREVLQYLQWQDGGARGRHWVLKSPIHLGSLDVLLSVYPGATVVHCHRDPCTAVASLCRLIAVVRQTRGIERFDLAEMGEMLLDSFARAWQSNLHQRERTGPPDRLLDVSFEQIGREPMQVIDHVYRSRGQRVSPEADRSMRAWEEAHPADRLGRREYSLERYGLSPHRVRQAFADYLDHFGPLLNC